MKINHIGVAVEDIGCACCEYEKLGYEKKGGILVDTGRRIQVQYIQNDVLRLELVAPICKGEPSPVNRFIGKGKTYEMYHICYEVEDMDASISEYKQKGYFLMEEPQKSDAMGGYRTAYLFQKFVGLVELVEIPSSVYREGD
ncbi:MAG: VOC family protein [Lachnospiraceae bacterium]|nr:VOC family protein [Lachnospiraceae bacterium]